MDVVFDYKDVQEMFEDYKRLKIDWAPVGEMLVEEVKQNFDAGGRPETWPPRKDGYPSHLVASGDLQQSIDYLVVGDGVEVHPGLDYGIHHILGTDRLPVRDYMLVPPEAEDEAVRIILEQLPE